MILAQGFIFLRHGQTDWNLEGRFQGHTDIALNETGLTQAQDAAERLKPQNIHRIVAIVAEHINLPVHIESGLKERSFGSFDGQVVADVKRQHGLPLSEPAASILPSDAEQWPQTLVRTREVVGTWLKAYPDEMILFIAHDGNFRALSETLQCSGLESRHGMPYAFKPAQDKWSVTEVPHT